jgi:hypothetical protein
MTNDLVGSFQLDVTLWEAWSPDEVARRLEGIDASWYVTAGWALDLFQGRQTREHEDLEIGVLAHQFDTIRGALAEFEFVVVGDGLGWPSTETTLASHHQSWVREPETGVWRLDVFREPWEGQVWICRRDPRIRLPGTSLVSRTTDGVPFVQPEVALLFKAKATRPKDEDDFAVVLPLLDAERRRWLRNALELVHPRHSWIDRLAT